MIGTSVVVEVYDNIIDHSKTFFGTAAGTRTPSTLHFSIWGLWAPLSHILRRQPRITYNSLHIATHHDPTLRHGLREGNRIFTTRHSLTPNDIWQGGTNFEFPVEVATTHGRRGNKRVAELDSEDLRIEFENVGRSRG